MSNKISCVVSRGHFGFHAVSVQEPGVWSYAKCCDACAATRLFLKLLGREKHAPLVTVTELQGSRFTNNADGTFVLEMEKAPFKLKQARKRGMAGAR